MHGNVWEWCQGRYGKNYYSNSVSVNPQDLNSGDNCVIRGGSWNYNLRGMRSANRYRNSPDYRRCGLGFRLVLQASVPSQVAEGRVEYWLYVAESYSNCVHSMEQYDGTDQAIQPAMIRACYFSPPELETTIMEKGIASHHYLLSSHGDKSQA